MGKYGFGLTGMINEKMMEQANDMVMRQSKEQADMSEREVYDVNFALAPNKDLFAMFGLGLLLCLGLMAKALSKAAIRAYGKGALFEGASYTAMEKAGFGISIFAIVIVVGFFVLLKTKAMPCVRQSVMYYKGNQYHFSQITRIKVFNRTFAKVYIDGKYAFWISADLLNYYTFLEWAKKCGVPVEGETELKAGDTGVVHATNKQAVIIIFAMVVVVAIFVAIFFWMMV